MPRSPFEAYVRGEATAFYAGLWSHPADRRAALERARRPLCPGVLSRLHAQNAALGPSPARSQQLAALEGGARAVVTGQQVGLWLGPLYTLYKAATAVCAARALAAESGEPVVPIFWLQSEDHDLVEIASCTLARTGRPPLRLQLPASSDNRVCVAELRLPGEIEDCSRTLHAELDNLPYAQAHLARLQRHYRPGARYVDAFAGLLAELFEPEGLLVLDPRDPALAAEAAPVHRRALLQAGELAGRLLEQGDALERAGLSPEVHVRPGAPLCFVHPGGAHTGRYRLAPSARGFALVGADGELELSALLALLESEPACFSTSALLRPILQDSWLPTAAYVGGPSEVAYFAQLGPLYTAFELEPPLIVPRARFRLVEAAVRHKLQQLGLRAEALADPGSGLLLQLSAADTASRGGPTPEALERELFQQWQAALSRSLEPLRALDPQLSAAEDKTREALRNSASKLAHKYANVLGRRHGELAQGLQRLQWALFPDSVPQERVYGLQYYAARYGDRNLALRVLAAIRPFTASIQEIAL